MDSLDASEKKKISEVMKKARHGQTDVGNMDWMYTRDKTNTDDYLLGKKIDKHFERGDKTPPKEDDVFGERIKANIALDMQAKMREDPLYAIKKREEESKRKILNNPVKMKELQKMVAQQKKEKKKKKKHKHKHRHGGSDEEDLVQQYLSILSQKQHQHSRSAQLPRTKSGKHNKLQRSSSSDSNDPPPRHRRRSPSSDADNPPPRQSRHQRSSPSEEEDSRTSKAYGLIKTVNHRSRSPAVGRQRKDSLSPVRHKTHGGKSRGQPPSPSYRKPSHKHRSPSPQRKHKTRSRSRSPRRKYGNHLQRKNHQASSPSPQRKRHLGKKRSPSPPRRKLTDEERQRRLQEMMDNARWRDEQRKSNVQRYQEEDRKEEAEQKKKGSSADFINPLMAQHASSSTVEDRLKRNKYNIQRTKAALDKNFTKH
ncbi:pre-mRNA-splicing factor CWC25 homolog [Haliotis cracherodii]|uniref:pre-mRNA-splicing factor CWC25 homolog n=1 Tax=Haliotis cracherodii TaxID=6455 RepID=UPI0039EBAB6F